MFGDQYIYCSVGDLHTKGKAKEQDTNRYIDVEFKFPLQHELAQAISKPMAKHLYKKAGEGYAPDSTIGDVNIPLDLGAQRVDLKDHAEMPSLAVIASAVIKKIWAKKTDGGEWEMRFTCSFPLGDTTAAVELMKRVKAGVWIQMGAEQPEMKGMEANEPADPADIEVGPAPA